MDYYHNCRYKPFTNHIFLVYFAHDLYNQLQCIDLNLSATPSTKVF